MDYETALKILLRATARHGVRPDVPIESEEYFRSLLLGYEGPEERVGDWLDQQVAANFRSIQKRPEWLQDPEWPILRGRPMTFVGQVDLPLGTTLIFDHSASFYVFWDPEMGATKVVVQAD